MSFKQVIILDEEASHASTKDLLKVNPISKVSKWSLNPIRKARQKVSLKKNRFIHDGFDLDLTCVDLREQKSVTTVSFGDEFSSF